MLIRLATRQDIPRIVEIYETARSFMRSYGNMSQWTAEYPHEDTFLDDIEHGWLYVVCDGETGASIAAFALIDGDDPTYRIIDGSWMDASPYSTFHRIASDGTHHGVFAAIVDFARNQKGLGHLRIDTHEDNTPMRRAIARCGFSYCGIIITTDGTPRMAFEWIAE